MKMLLPVVQLTTGFFAILDSNKLRDALKADDEVAAPQFRDYRILPNASNYPHDTEVVKIPYGFQIKHFDGESFTHIFYSWGQGGGCKLIVTHIGVDQTGRCYVDEDLEPYRPKRPVKGRHYQTTPEALFARINVVLAGMSSDWYNGIFQVNEEVLHAIKGELA